MSPDICQWESSEIKVIRLTEGYSKGVELRARRFVKQNGDRLHRTWFENGEEQRWYIEPYALVDLEGAKAQYDKYLKSGLNGMLKALLGPKDELLWGTYGHAIRRLQSHQTPHEEKDLISKTLELWAAVRLTTKSFEIIGEETLGIKPLKGSVPIPPVMGAQLDFILLNQTLPKLRRETLECLQNMTQAKKQKTWLTTYLVTFILLHNVALITAHDRSYAKKHGLKVNNHPEQRPDTGKLTTGLCRVTLLGGIWWNSTTWVSSAVVLPTVLHPLDIRAHRTGLFCPPPSLRRTDLLGRRKHLPSLLSLLQ
jgi:hypothetical protein